MTTLAKLAALRQIMQQKGFAAWIVPSADPHLSEYLPEHWKSRCYLSGFTGSVGTLVITLNDAGLWVDSRYWQQAEQQLSGSGIRLQKVGVVADYADWLVTHLSKGEKVGISPEMLSLAEAQRLQQRLAAKSIELDYRQDVIDDLWLDRPALPKEAVFIQQQTYIVTSATEKIARLRQFMQEQQVENHLISSLDDIAWLTNLRGNDVSFNPVFLAHLLVTPTEVTLFADKAKFSAEVLDYLSVHSITLADYADISLALQNVAGTLLLDPAKVAMSTLAQLNKEVKLVEQINPTTYFKSVKSEREIQYIRQAMEQDGVALCQFFADLEQRLQAGIPTTELDIDAMLYHYRSQQEGFISASFNSIVGFNGNAAMPHYSPTLEQNAEISGQGLLLIDSGAQYQCGTTDITRVIPIGEPTELQKQDYTLVLKAHIALAEAVFPEHILGPLLDAICRKPMWLAQRNYGHGTGHGVGYFLNVHEGPQVINYHLATHPRQAIEAGMLTSNEPGLYRVDKWGIRIENLVISQPIENPQESEFGKFLYFETVTLCPIDTKLIDLSLLTAEEITWLNRYHQQVRSRLLDYTQGAAREWLIRNTEEI